MIDVVRQVPVFGEGLLEIGLVLTSMYFISKKKMFPVMGVLSGVIGVGIAITGFLLAG